MPRALKNLQDLSKNERRKTYFGVWIGVMSTFVANTIWNWPMPGLLGEGLVIGFSNFQLILSGIGFIAIYLIGKDLF